MSKLVTTSQCLVDIVKEITQELLAVRFKRKYKCYNKIDFEIINQDGCFNIRITKCSSGCLNLKVLFTNIVKKHPNILEFNQDVTVATLLKKTNKAIKTKKVIYVGNSSFILIKNNDIEEQKKFSLLKFYTSLELLFHVKVTELRVFSNSMLKYFKEIEQFDSNIKISYRKNSDYVYRNRVPMDDIILSCKIVSSSLYEIFENSLDKNFQEKLLKLLGITNPYNFEETVGCLLLSQVHHNFKMPVSKTKI